MKEDWFAALPPAIRNALSEPLVLVSSCAILYVLGFYIWHATHLLEFFPYSSLCPAESDFCVKVDEGHGWRVWFMKFHVTSDSDHLLEINITEFALSGLAIIISGKFIIGEYNKEEEAKKVGAELTKAVSDGDIDTVGRILRTSQHLLGHKLQSAQHYRREANKVRDKLSWQLQEDTQRRVTISLNIWDNDTQQLEVRTLKEMSLEECFPHPHARRLLHTAREHINETSGHPFLELEAEDDHHRLINQIYNTCSSLNADGHFHQDMVPPNP